MSVHPRKLADGSYVYWVATSWKGRVCWRRSGKDKRAAERLNAKLEKEKKAGTFEPKQLPSNMTLREFAPTFWANRKARKLKDEMRATEMHVLEYEWFADVPMAELRPRHGDNLLKKLREKGLVDKTIYSILSPIHGIFRAAVRQELIPSDPLVFEPKTFDFKRKVTAEIYQPAEVVVLTRNEHIDPGIRVLNALLFYTGMREGEACGRKWRDLEEAPELFALRVATQYNDQPLKVDNPRAVPVHPELADILSHWAAVGFEQYTCSPPSPDEFIVPNISKRANARHHTKKSFSRQFLKACQTVGIHHHTRAIHATRNTFITLCRRGGGEEKLVQLITHNAKGTMVDQYTQTDWAPLCRTIRCLTIDAHQKLHYLPKSSGPSDSLPGYQQIAKRLSLRTVDTDGARFDTGRLHPLNPRNRDFSGDESKGASKKLPEPTDGDPGPDEVSAALSEHALDAEFRARRSM